MSFVDFLVNHSKLKGENTHLGFSSANSIEVDEQVYVKANQLSKKLILALKQPQIQYLEEINGLTQVRQMFEKDFIRFDQAIERIKEEMTFYRFSVSQEHFMSIKFEKNFLRFSIFAGQCSKDQLYLYQQVNKIYDKVKVNIAFFDKGIEGVICLL